ncbi:protease IV [Nonlabens tegetincola]|uniref:Protease IV n=2 Tax=Nonlabens tegetincola TaxID=323273 RepID=A0A090Q1B1_9FLAO|nr:protease IV [Nonlabens tegetincola]
MMEPQTAQAWLPTIASWLQHKDASLPAQLPEKETTGYFIDRDGVRFRESEGSDPALTDLIGVLHINGPMIKYGNWCAYGSDELIAMADAHENDDRVIGHLWLGDSGGGAVNSIAPYLEFHSRRKKPLISAVDLCASANLYSLAPSDKLYALNNLSSMIGSIGVTTTLYDYSNYLKNQGVAERVINALQSTHKNTSFFKARNGDAKDFQEEHLNPLAQKFMDDMIKYRPSIQADIEGILNGKMFYAAEATEYGLIDGVRTMQQCIQELRDMAGRKTLATNFMFN